MIEASTQHYNDREKSDFLQSLKVINVKKKRMIETLVCVGDGLGIKKQITY